MQQSIYNLHVLYILQIGGIIISEVIRFSEDAKGEITFKASDLKAYYSGVTVKHGNAYATREFEGEDVIILVVRK